MSDFPMKTCFHCCFLALFFLLPYYGSGQRKPGNHRLYGALPSDPKRTAQMSRIGANVSTLSICWSRYEPKEGEFDRGYRDEILGKIAVFRKAGMKIVLDFGLQYPPAWVFAYPHSRFVNQYGVPYNEDSKPGANGVNAVFNSVLREKQKRYVARVFRDLGTDFYAVRLGWGFYGELCYPIPKFKGKNSCFWCFDTIAQGKTKGLPKAMKSCPVPGWIPGTPGKDHAKAKAFIDWYMRCLQNYHDWQIETVRDHYNGFLIMMYPSWGVRPGQIQESVKRDLANANGEITRGYDFKRFIAGIDDPKVIVYTTWLDSNPEFGDDNNKNPARWSPVHYLASLAEANPLHLRVWGENTGRGSFDAMKLSFERMRRYKLMGLIWAFEDDLFSGKYATYEQFSTLIDKDRDKTRLPK